VCFLGNNVPPYRLTLTSDHIFRLHRTLRLQLHLRTAPRWRTPPPARLRRSDPNHRHGSPLDEDRSAWTGRRSKSPGRAFQRDVTINARALGPECEFRHTRCAIRHSIYPVRFFVLIACTDLGTVRLTREGEVRWTTISVFQGCVRPVLIGDDSRTD
jgi:hypothetical protein